MPNKSDTEPPRPIWQSPNEAWPGSSLLTNLLPLPAPAAPSFPTFQQVVESDATPPSPPKRSGLFSALLGDPRVLWHDLLERPKHYEEGVSELIQSLVHGHKKLDGLSPAEQTLLDRATLDFSQPHRPAPQPVPVPPPPRRQSPKTTEVEYHEPVSSPFGDGLDPYWWLK